MGSELSETPAESNQSLTSDPAYYIMVAVFAFLTTALPIALGQPRFLPVAQAVALTVFIAIPLKAGLWKRSALLMTMWLLLVVAIVAITTKLTPSHVELSIGSGFAFHTNLLAWLYNAKTASGVMQENILSDLVVTAGVIVGSLVSAGGIGNWFLMRLVNQTGFGIGIIWGAIEGRGGLLLAIPLWTVLRIAGLAGFVILFSTPLLSGQWSPHYYWKTMRSLILSSAILLILGILLGMFGPTLWQSLIDTQLN